MVSLRRQRGELEETDVVQETDDVVTRRRQTTW